MNDEESQILSFLTSEKFQKFLAKYMPGNKPAGWKTRSNSPYYNSINGYRMKAVLDEMMKDNEPRVFYYKDYPEFSKNTLYFQINQGLNYLTECLDPQGIYLEYRKTKIDVNRRNPSGIAFDMVKVADLVAKPIEIEPEPEPEPEVSYLDHIEEYMKVANVGDKPLRFKNNLTSAELKTLLEQFEPLQDWAIIVKPDEIRVVRISL